MEPVDSSKSAISFEQNPYEYLLLDTTTKAENPVYKPVLGIGRGVFTFFGDVKDNYSSNPIVGRQAWLGTVSRTLNPFLKLNFEITYGKLTGNAHTPMQNLNFQSDVLIGGINLSYNFKHLIKKTSAAMPYLSLGIESFEFNSKADMYDANGKLYNYWSDGTIRNISETQGNEMNSIILYRDYKYETDLRELNIDGLGKYPQVAFAIPIDMGFELIYSQRFSVRLGATYHLTFNNNIDNVSETGTGSRKGNKHGDNFLVTYISIHYDLFSSPKLSVLEEHYSDIQFASIDAEDEDGDGVIDLWDECPETPAEIEVNSKGCPFDNDNDGFPNYLDKEIESSKNAIVNLDGVTFTEEQIIASSNPPNALITNRLCDVYPSLCREYSGIKKFRTMYMDIPEKFKPVDINNDGYISIEELNLAVDKFFDFGTNFTIEDIYELNDFFFAQ
ncbi:MAG: hypothetical protein COX07_02390 [Bacteroidetes bacterium CG23_combo_of_CG06-09_8_20_14_all_32_9]|nr:MAG: hypothetical protein COX07_02390 [Bacteroidetes bacterium CG23_combo_of_CG06-09_8_20_14_all_32_9]